MPSPPYNESVEQLSQQAVDVHRAIASLIEELEAVDYYQQRADITPDAELKEVLIHNRDEEIEHSCMILEWLRRRIPKFDEEIGTYINAPGSIIAAEEAAEGGGQEEGAEEGESAGGESAGSNPDLGIGNLKRGGK